MSCGAQIVAWEGVIKDSKGEHNHESDKDRVVVLLAERQHLQRALVNPQIASARNLTSGISTELKGSDNVHLMSSPKAIQRRLERGKEKEKNYPKIPKDIAAMSDSFPDWLRVGLKQIELELTQFR